MRYFILLIFFPVFCYGQTNDSLNHSVLKLNLISLVDVNTFPTVQLSYEKQLNKDLSLSGEAGYQLYSFYKNDTSFVHPAGFKANVELRYYNPFPTFLKEIKTTDLTGIYIAANVFHRQSRDNRVLLYYHSNDTTLLKDYFYATKKIWGVNLLIGYQFNASEKIVFDIYAGIGKMIRTAKENNVDYNEKSDTLLRAKDFNVNQTLNDSYISKNNGWKTNVTIGARMGIRL